MEFDREPWLARFEIGDITPWRCVHCRKGMLTAPKELLRAEETELSKANRNSNPENWGPELERELFGGLLRCSNAACLELVAVAGIGRIEENYSEARGHTFDVVLTPQHFIPAPHIVEVPPAASDEVRGSVLSSFALYWSDPSAAGNRIRSAVECLLDDQGVPRRRKGENRELPLHARLVEYQAKQPQVAERLMAIKWLGNSGTHGSLSQHDVLDAYELLDLAFEDLFHGRTKRLTKLAKTIAKRKGPQKRST